MRSSPVMLRSTSPPRHSRVCSSTIETILIGRPSMVASNWKSTAHTRSGASAITHSGAVEVRGVCDAAAAAPGAPLRAKAVGSSRDSPPSPHRGRRNRPVGTRGADDPWRRCAARPATPHPDPPAWPRHVVSLGGAVLPGHPASEPFADPQHPLQVTNGRPPGVPGLEVSPRDLLERSLLQLGISEQPLEGGVLPLEVLEPFGVLGLQPAKLVASTVIGHLRGSRREVVALGEQPIERHLAHNLLRGYASS